MFRLIQALLLSGVLLLTACGGGSSSGGGSGTYAGTYTVFVNTGGNIASGSGTYVATISGNSVTITFDDGTVLTGELSQPGGVTAGSATGTIAGVVDGCTSGTIRFQFFFNEEGTGFAGTIGGENVVCGGVSVDIVGTHRATRS